MKSEFVSIGASENRTVFMEKTIKAEDLGRKVCDILDEVQADSTMVLERNGEPAAAIVPIWQYRQWQEDRERFFATLQQMAEQANLSPEEAEALAMEAVADVRGHRDMLVEPINAAAERADMTPEEAEQLALESVAAVRAERRRGD